MTADGTLAGADIDIPSAMRNSITMLGVPVEEALRMASLNPAKFLELDDRPAGLCLDTEPIWFFWTGIYPL